MTPSSRLIPTLFLTALLIAGCDSATAPASGTAGGSTAKTLPEAYAGLFTYGFGAAVGDTLFNDTRIKGIATANFNSLSPENAGKWGSLQPTSAATYNWTNLDNLLLAAYAQGIKIRLHAPVWHSQTPSWLFVGSGTGGIATEEELTARIDTFFNDVLTHTVPYTGGKKVADLIWAWDVVNEAASDSGGYRTSTSSGWAKCWTTNDASGVPGYIIYAFTKARALTTQVGHPEIKLVYNDYSLENTTKFTTIKTIVSTLKSKGLIDALGNQAHWGLTNFYASPAASPSEFQSGPGSTFANLDAVITFVESLPPLKLQLTELDLAVCSPYYNGSFGGYKNPTLDNYKTSFLPLQAEAYRQIFILLRTHADKTGGCVEHVTFWGVTDDSTWLNADSPAVYRPRPLLWYKASENGGGVKQPIWDALTNF